MDSESFGGAVSSFVASVRAYNASHGGAVVAEVVRCGSGAALVLGRRHVVAWSQSYSSPELYCRLGGAGALIQMVDTDAVCDDDCLPILHASCSDEVLLQRASSSFGTEGALRVAECPTDGCASVCVNACNARFAVSEIVHRMSDSPSDVAYLAAFLSLYGPSVDLCIPPDLHLWLCTGV